MTHPLPRSLGLAFLVHAVPAVLVVLLLIQTAPPLHLPAPASFVLVDPGDSSSPPTANSAPVPPVALVHVPAPPTPPPTRVEPDADSTTSAPTPPAHSPTPAPARPHPPRMTIAQFNALHPTATPPDTTRSRPTPVHHISETFPLGSKPGTDTAPAALSDDSTPAFVPALLRDLRAAFVPTGSDLGGLSAIVEFQLMRDGSLAEVRLVHSSGVAAFDAAALAAFRSVRARGFQSTDVGVSYDLTFRATAE